MKYIGQYIKKLCPEVVITNSKTTESVYYEMGHNFIVRLSRHIGLYEKGKISVTKSFNTDDFIVMIDTSPFPLIKNRKEVRETIKTAYEMYLLNTLSKDYHAVKAKAEIESLTDWDKFWSKVCSLTPHARYFTNPQKAVIKEYFNKGLRGECMIANIKKIKPVTSVESVTTILNSSLVKLKDISK